jgi:hypothetical protein
VHANDQDMSDPQYRSFRNNLASLLFLAGSYLGFSTLQTRISPTARSRSAFIVTYAIVMLFILHGTSTIKILALLSLNYIICLSPRSPIFAKAFPALLFAGNMGMLFLNERYDGYRFSNILGGLAVLVSTRTGVLEWLMMRQE